MTHTVTVGAYMVSVPPISPLVPLDRNGVPMPTTAARGLKIIWELEGQRTVFHGWYVRAATRNRIDVMHCGAIQSFPPSEWVAWLWRQAARGFLSCHLPGCDTGWCGGCDGRLVINGKAPRALPQLAGGPVANTDLLQRDARIVRAAYEVLQNYRFERENHEGAVQVSVFGGTLPWVVEASLTWEYSPRCCCPDGGRGANFGYCKHVIAVLMREPDLRPQLLDLFL